MKMINRYEFSQMLAGSLRRMGCFMVATLSLAVLSAFTMAPQASAAAPDGTYKLVSASGSLTLGGEPLELDAATIKSIIGSSTGKVTVLNSQVKLNRSGAVSVFQKLGEGFGFDVSATISGPKVLILTKSGTTYVGKTLKPVVANVTVNTGSEVLTGIVRSHFRVLVQGRTMTVNMPVTGELFGMPLKGQLKATCRR